MKETVIGVIGGTGGMGGWFASLLRGDGYTVHCAGRRSGMRPEDMARVCQVLVISVPIGVTCEVIGRVGPFMSPDSLLTDLTSLKEAPVREMLRASQCEVIGCHPLFGPEITGLSGHNVILCPGRGDLWFSWFKSIFEKHQAVITVTTPEEHDRMMSVVQVMNHLHTMHLGMILGQENMTCDKLLPWSTPVLKKKMEMLRKVFQNQPGMYAEMLVNNPHLERICELYQETFSLLEKTLARKDADALCDLLHKQTKKIWPKK
ncbi:MAG: prephenate dehydrogenase/arogenate dehydrogenase family protein [Deltaproteobacteria bacterium]|nr:prephenate dehydrogenase/arogenate dehydrogenase family protein [Deltaproteobacteria bacterium]